MIKYLICREVGLHRPQVLTNAERSNRTYNIQLSQTKEVHSLHEGPISCLDIDFAEGRYLLSGGADAVISIFDIQETLLTNGAQRPRFIFDPIIQIPKNQGHRYGVSSIQWFPHDNGMFFSGSFDETVKVWDPNLVKAVRTWEMEGKVYSIAYSPISTLHSFLAVGSEDPDIRLCDLRAKTSAHTLEGHRDGIRTLKWCPGNEYLLASGSADRTIRFWDVRKAGCLLSLDQHGPPEIFPPGVKLKVSKTTVTTAHDGLVTGLAFTPEGAYLLSTGSDSRMRCWDVDKGQNTLINYLGTRNSSKASTQIALSSNGEVVYHPNGRAIHSYRVHTGEQLGSYKGHYEGVNCCVFHPLNEELYSGGKDNMILVWTPSFEAEGEEEEDMSDVGDTWSD